MNSSWDQCKNGDFPILAGTEYNCIYSCPSAVNGNHPEHPLIIPIRPSHLPRLRNTTLKQGGELCREIDSERLVLVRRRLFPYSSSSSRAYVCKYLAVYHYLYYSKG
jgi:hypothetical protein